MPNDDVEASSLALERMSLSRPGPTTIPNILDPDLYPNIVDGIIEASDFADARTLRLVSRALCHATDRVMHRYISVWETSGSDDWEDEVYDAPLEAETLTGTWPRGFMLPRLDLATYAGSVRALDLPIRLRDASLSLVRPRLIRLAEGLNCPIPSPPTTVAISHQIPREESRWLGIPGNFRLPPTPPDGKLVLAVIYLEPWAVASISLPSLPKCREAVLIISLDYWPDAQAPVPVALVHPRGRGFEAGWVVMDDTLLPTNEPGLVVHRLDEYPDTAFLDDVVLAAVRAEGRFTFVEDEWDSRWLARGDPQPKMADRIREQVARVARDEGAENIFDRIRVVTKDEYEEEVGPVEWALSSAW